MEIAESIKALRDVRRRWRDEQCKVAFVPTMGNLHDGHLSLLHLANELADKTVCSIFINPLQFDRAEDLEHYPKTMKDDIAGLQSLNTDLLFVPTTDMIYPYGAVSRTTVNVTGITDSMEGKHRKGHFTGVATVVCKLFNLVEPDIAIFGKKDFQQLLLIRQMTEDLNFPIEIVGSPTKRTPEGLALSSRNGNLTDGEREQATEIYRTLKDCIASLRDGDREFEALEARAMQRLSAAGFAPEYFRIRNIATLKPPNKTDDAESLVVLTAAVLGKTRLIYNMRVADSI